jgi:hypothetical protein
MFGSVVNRLGSSVRRALSQYAVGSQEPELAFDFVDNEYRTNNSGSTFASAITHARSGNAVMTDGYGPELVTNGDFSDGTTGWDTDGNPVVNRGVVTIPIDNATTEYIEQTLSTVSGKTYIVSYDYINADATGRGIRTSANDGTSGNFNGDLAAENITLGNSNGNVELVFTATSSNSTVRIICNTSTNGAFVSIDNVSVREMPVLKWAPHNLIDDSDDLTGLGTPTGATRTSTVLTEDTSTDSHSIQSGYAPVVGEKYTLACEVKLESGTRFVSFRGFGEGGANKYPIFNLVNGTIEDSGTSFTDVSITNVGSGYYLLKASVVVSGAFTWQIHMQNSATSGIGGYSYTGDGTSAIAIRKVRQYRSDLGGMVDNPDKTGHDADYVPTDNVIAYLPRIGHHVYNGNAWVNEGLLAESEARTNLYDNNDSMHTNGTQNSTLSANGGTAPDGSDDAVKMLETTATGEHTVLMAQSVITTGKTYTCSVFVKSIGGRNAKFGFTGVNFPSAVRINFDLENVTTASPSESTIQEIGNGWYRLSVTATSDATGLRGNTNAILQSLDGTTSSFAGDTSKGVLFYGMQIEEGATPSSYIPTVNTTSVTRAAETFTIPSANLPWPEPQYIGSELVDNGDFADTSDWNLQSGVSIGSGVLSTDGTTTGELARQTNIGITSGNVYAISLDVTSLTAGKFGVKLGGTTPVYFDTTGSHEAYIVATATDNVQIMGLSGTTGSVDNISVREINPLSVSIGIEGRISYADEDTTTQTQFFRWREDGDNYIFARIRTDQGTGRIDFLQEESNDVDVVVSNGSYLSSGILVPYNIASRHGSTFINGATNGVALTADTTPTALPDLSSTDLNLAYDYMGTISEFRVWDKDLGDDGIVEATNPSLEPSLSLTFEGTGTNSFVVNDWSE